jgi:hypothetical protein
MNTIEFRYVRRRAMWRLRYEYEHKKGRQKGEKFEPSAREVTTALQDLFDSTGRMRYRVNDNRAFVTLSNVGESNIELVTYFVKPEGSGYQSPPVTRQTFYLVRAKDEKPSRYNFLREPLELTDAVRVFTLHLKNDRRWFTDYKWEEPPEPLWPVVQPVPLPTTAEKKSGVIYLAKSGENYKIGKTVDPEGRMRQLSIQLPEELVKVHEITTDDIDYLERHWHRYFSENRRNGEWFALSDDQVREFMRFRHVETT